MFAISAPNFVNSAILNAANPEDLSPNMLVSNPIPTASLSGEVTSFANPTTDGKPFTMVSLISVVVSANASET